MEHSNELLSGGVEQYQFYQAPVPLLIGNLPFGDDFKEKRHEYEYLNYYIVPSPKGAGDKDKSQPGVLYYNKFFKKYTMITSTIASWSYLYPGIKEGNYYYSLNPFVNGPNGACAWIMEVYRYDGSRYLNSLFKCPNIIYYNFSENRYEVGLGEDVFSKEGFMYQLNMHDPVSRTKKKSTHPNTYIIPSANKSTIKARPYYSSTSYVLTNDDLRDYKVAQIHYDWRVGYSNVRKFGQDKNITVEFNLDDLTDPINLTTTFATWPINTSAPETANRHKSSQLQISHYIDNNKNDLAYERLDFIPDLDHEEDPEKYEEICGVYENNSEDSKKQMFIGSVVIGSKEHKDDIGWFIGINKAVSEIFAVGDVEDNQYYSRYRTNVTNVTLVQKSDNTIVGATGQKYLPVLDKYDFLVTLGYRIYSDKKRYLVYNYSSTTTGFYKGRRLFLVDDDPDLLYSQRKIWYCDLSSNGTNVGKTMPRLFRYPFYFLYGSPDTFTKLTFNYINLDDESDTKDPIDFELIGCCRENAYYNLLGNKYDIKAFDESKRNYQWPNFQPYVGYWDQPIVNFKEEN